MKVLLANDGSVHSASALEAVIAHPWSEGTTCRVITIAEPQNKFLDSIMVGGLGDMAIRAQKALDDDLVVSLNETLAALREKFGAANVTGECIQGDPKELIVAQANSWGADLIVIGARGASAAPDDTWVGGVARSVMHNAPCSVQVLQPESTLSIEKKQLEKLGIEDSRYLVAINDQMHSDALLDAILKRPWPPNSRFQIICVIPSLEQISNQKLIKNKDFSEYASKGHTAAKLQAETLVQNAAIKLIEKFPQDKVTAHVLEGSPRNVILQVAQDWPADMIILGAHEKDVNVMEKIFGSTAAAVMWNAPCSVEIMKLAAAVKAK